MAEHTHHDDMAPRHGASAPARGAGHASHTAPPERSGHADHAEHGGHGGHAARFRRLFWVMLILATPTVGFSGMFASIVGYPLPGGAWATWVSPVVGTAMYVWGGLPFLSGAVGEMRARRPGMMLLIALAISVAFLASWGSVLGLVDAHMDFWWELALLIVIMLLGHWVEMRSLAQTTSALDSLAALLPDVAWRVDGEATVAVSPANLTVGDLVVVRPGARVPADGRVVSGAASMDESMITGESRTVRRGPGDAVVAGTVATDSGLRIRVSAVGEDTALAGIARLVAEAQESSSRAQRIADRAAGWLFWFALGVGVVTAVVWASLGSPDDAAMRTITVLVIACPHALGLAIPLVVSIATERAAHAGVLVKDRLALETMRRVDTVLFDKTGTLTKGRPVVTDLSADPAYGDEGLLSLAAAAEADSEHPLARAIVAAARARGLDVPAASDFSSSPAVGVSALVRGRLVQVGGARLPVGDDPAVRDDARAWHEAGATVLHVLVDGDPAGALRLEDELREESSAAVDALHARGIRVVMITGDAHPVAAYAAQALGVDRFFAGVRPEDKAAKVAQLRAEGRRVAMVGDGVNDAPALAAADVGVAIGAGTDVAVGSAGVILAGDDPRAVVSMIELSRAGYRKMAQNLWWAAGYNLVSVPLAAGVLAPVGFVLPMSVGAILMSVSTLVVAVNAQLLRRLDLGPDVVAGRAQGRDGAPGPRRDAVRVAR
ncbi:MAG TPA: heavy metal translocating P-type ATPase [Microbacteriaceae bacterium]|nr:heavy metal translocating P-type ATPase [Microbacteriaceae bacterium]